MFAGDSDIVLNIQCSELDRGVDRVPDLNRVEWPSNPNRLKLLVSFEGIGLSNVESLPPNNLVETLAFPNNLISSIWPRAFSDLPGLRRLSLTHNKLTNVNPDIFTKLHTLEELDLSYNSIAELNTFDFIELKRLKKLNLQDNRLTTIPTHALEKNSKLEDLDLSRNFISVLWFKRETSVLKNLRRLNLNANNITNISAESFPPNSIEFLDLSSNAISYVSDSALTNCQNIRELNMDSNKIHSPFAVPATVLSVSLAHNRLRDWPQFPAAVRHIDLADNELYAMYDPNYEDFDKLEELKLSGNQLSSFELVMRLPKLLTLDLSYNLLQHIPGTINAEMLPSLAELRLDGNPIADIYFPEEISLRILHLNDLRQLRSINAGAMEHVSARREPEMNGCVQLYISNCPALEEIEDGAFNGSAICLLDLSYNNLTALPEDVVDWSTLREGVNLQGNPWDCGCSMQWMLDTLLPLVHQKYATYLTDLRCETPRERQGLRMVHWLNWREKVLCNDGESNQSYRMESSTIGNILTSASPLTLALGVSIALSLSLAVGLSAYVVRSHRRHYAIRRAMLRRRQSAKERARSGHKEQFTALNTLSKT